MGFILFLIASILWLPLTFLNFIAVFLTKGLSNSYFLQTAIDIDKFGNRNFRTLLNKTLIKDKKHKFGDVSETISSVLGKNEKDHNLTKIGKAICFVLNFFDKNHCINSINK